MMLIQVVHQIPHCTNAKVSWLLSAYCVTSDNYDNTAGHPLVLSSFLQHEGLWQVRTPHFTAGTERKPRFLPEQLPRVGREPPTRLTHTHSMSKQKALKKQPLLEMVTLISKPALPWICISSDYSIPCWWALLSWAGSKGSSVASTSEPEIVGKKTAQVTKMPSKY